jgi:hypothetical protein
MPAGDVGTAFGNAELDPPGEPDGDEGGYVGNGEGVSGDVTLSFRSAVAGSTIGPRTHISRFDDERGR